MTDQERSYPGCTLVAVIDGDTCDFWFDYGFHCGQQHRLRLAHVNAPEKNTAAGVRAKAFVQDWFDDRAGKCTVTTTVNAAGVDQTEKYGRYLAVVTDSAGKSLNDALLAKHHARPYEGGKR